MTPSAPRPHCARLTPAAIVRHGSAPPWHSKLRAGTSKTFDRWSSAAGNYGGERDTAATWRSINGCGGIGAGTLFKLARDAGWNDDAAPIYARDSNRTRKEPDRPAPKHDPAAIWERCVAADPSHPYIALKLGLHDGVRVYRGPLTIAGTAVDGALVVPARDIGGALRTLQFIPAEGKKLNLPGHSVAGFLVVGGEITPGPVYVVEGIGQAWSAHQATTRPAVVCFGAGNVRKVADALRSAHPGADVVLVPDVGKEAQAAGIAAATGCSFVTLPDDLGSNGDVNDLHLRDGMAAVANLLARPTRPEPQVRVAEPSPVDLLKPMSAPPLLPADAPRVLARFAEAQARATGFDVSILFDRRHWRRMRDAL